MRELPWTLANRFRVRNAPGGYHSLDGDDFGVFMVQSYDSPFGIPLKIIASSGEGWEHVSVSTQKRCPNWPEMTFVKDLFWSEDECVMQLHVPKKDHINCHPYCLHLWKPIGVEIPRPDSILVGVKRRKMSTAAKAVSVVLAVSEAIRSAGSGLVEETGSHLLRWIGPKI